MGDVGEKKNANFGRLTPFHNILAYAKSSICSPFLLKKRRHFRHSRVGYTPWISLGEVKLGMTIGASGTCFSRAIKKWTLKDFDISGNWE